MKFLLSAPLAALALLPLAGHAAEYANVVSATPVIASVDVPRQVCSDATQYVRPQPTGAGAAIGAIAGGVLGSAFGGGFGRAAATGLGVVAGAAIGNSVEGNAYPPTAVPVRRCRTVASVENRTVGYDVEYDYAGRRYTARLARDPGARLAIDVRPSGVTPLDRAAPPQGYYDAPPYQNDPQAEYDAPPAAYDAPAPVYYRPAPAYYAPPAYVVQPAIGIGIGYWGGHGWHHRY